MNYDTENQFLSFLDFMGSMGFLKEIGTGSQGICYLNLITKKVYKIFHQFFDDDKEYYVEYTKEEFLRFSDIKNNTFIWPEDVIIVENKVVGYVSNFVNARSLYQINPLLIDLNHFQKSVFDVSKDLKIISERGVVSYDTVYNTLYGKGGIFLIDNDDYTHSDDDINKIYNINVNNFNIGIMYFLIDNYFDEFISNYKELKEMYCHKGININEFILLFRKYINEYVGKDVVNLLDASCCINKKSLKRVKLERLLY